jgi:peptidoglycan/xylan/chitin deacetylase (PgdA/CDA1 family)
MSRFSASVSFLLAVLVLFLVAVVMGERSAGTGSVTASPSAVASSVPRTAEDSAARSPRGDSTASPVPRPPRSAPKRETNEKFQPAPELPAKRRGVVYLTFDDGPSEYTPAILNILRATGSTATFFEVGFRQAKRPATAAQVRAQGSNIGNHTYSHPDLTALTSEQIRWEVARGPRSRCVRPPFGATDPRVHRIVTQQGLHEVLWTTDTLDWNRPGTAQIVTRAIGPAVQAGSIVLMHDGGGDRSQTVAALPKIISTLQKRGYLIRRIPGC